jgi:hypothetical protein
MVEFELSGNTYRAGKMDAFKQFHVSRKIAPIVPTLIPIFVRLSKDKKLTEDLGAFSELLGPFAEGLAGMSDADSEYIIATCLAVVSRESNGNWAAVWNKGANSCMFDDMDLGVMMQIVIKVVQDSLGPFIQGLLMSQAGTANLEA